jgi:two-component system, NarL family, sensor kinase
MARGERSVARTIGVSFLLGALVLAAVTMAALFAIRRVATTQALDDAKQLTAISARLVERRISEGFVEGDANAVGLVDGVVRDAVLIDPVVRVKIWGPDGTILYSDALEQIGKRYESGKEELEDLAPGAVEAEVSDLTAPENVSERGSGELLEVYTPIEAPDGTPLLFETYQQRASVAAAQDELLRAFTPVLLVALAAFALLMIPLAWSLARRVRRDAAERERLLQRAIESSEQERRRIAGDLHDGPVQELAGLSMRLVAEADQASGPEQRRALTETADAVRGSVSTLRSAIVGIYPPNLTTAGLGPALADLTTRLTQAGVRVDLDVEDPGGYGLDVDQLLYRACREGLRNVERHAGASSVTVRVRHEGDRAWLEVADDGRGIDPSSVAPSDASTAAAGAEQDRHGDAHLGLQIVRDLVVDAGGELAVGPRTGGGTVLRVEVPIP